LFRNYFALRPVFSQDLTCRADLPCEYIEVQSVWVRGELGPLTVYAVDGGHLPHYDKPHVWTVHYKGTHDPSFNNLVKLQLDPPKRIEAGGRVGFYVHSTLPGDQSIVYDNTRHRYAPEEEDEEEGGGLQPVLQISPGVAHLSHVPFGGRAPWGRWAAPLFGRSLRLITLTITHRHS
jgi:hypothetical protein